MPLYRLAGPLPSLDGPIVLAAFDGWVDAGSAATTALAAVAHGGTQVADFDPDELFDYRSRRPTLEIRDGRLSSLDLARGHPHPRAPRRARPAGPDRRRAGRPLAPLRGGRARAARLLDVRGWVSLGAIPAAVPHTRPVPILGTEARPGLLKGGVSAGPTGVLRVPSAALSWLEMAAGDAGIAAVGYFAQIPHYVSGPYAPASVELLKSVERHLDIELPRRELADEGRALRLRLDAAAAADETTRTYVERLESMVDESRLPEGDDLISEIEKFLRDRDPGEA